MIETKRLILRPISMQDVDDIFEYAQDAETGPRAGWPPHKSVDDTKQIIQKWLDPNNNEKVFAILFKDDNKVVGTMGITYLNKQTKDEQNFVAKKLIEQNKNLYEIGLTLAKVYWSMGIGTEALSAMLDYIFQNLNADVVLTLHYAANIGSKKIQEKNNLKIIDTFERETKWYNTDCTTMVIRGKTKEEWHKDKE